MSEFQGNPNQHQNPNTNYKLDYQEMARLLELQQKFQQNEWQRQKYQQKMGDDPRLMTNYQQVKLPQKSYFKWYLLIFIFVVLLIASQVLRFFKIKWKNEFKLNKLMEKAKEIEIKKKEQKAYQHKINEEKKIQQEQRKKERISQQIMVQDQTKFLGSVSQAGSEFDIQSQKSGYQHQINIQHIQKQIDGFQKIQDFENKEKLSPVNSKQKKSLDINRKISREEKMLVRDDLSIASKSSQIDDAISIFNENDSNSNKKSKYPITRICLTGGPCAGKTTALATLSLHLKQIGYRVLQVPEAATILMKGGALIQTPKMSFSNAVKFQINLMRLQMQLEDIFVEIAQSSEQPTIILCDRGVMDGSAYTDENVWQAILDETGWSTIQLRDKRYEAVVHLVSAADGAESFYSHTTNEARYESVQEAVELDKKLINAWVGHPQFNIIQNGVHSFQEKIDKCMSTVLNFIGLPSPSAFVKKYLLIIDQNSHDLKVPKNLKKEFFQLDENFLQTGNPLIETNVVRKIGKNDSFIYSNEIRFIQNNEIIVRKKQITAREYIEFLETKDLQKKEVRKIRQCFIYERQYFIVESYANIDGHPNILRLETTGGENQQIRIPPFIKVFKEVTDDPNYFTKNMADINYKMPAKDKEQIYEKLIELQKQQQKK